MKLLFLSAFLFLAPFTLAAQTADSLLGNWKFKDVYNADKQKAEFVEMLRGMFSDMTLQVTPDKKYKFQLLEQTENGQWLFDSTAKTLTLKSSKGEEKLKIISVTSNQLIISLAEEKSFVLERVVNKKP